MGAHAPFTSALVVIRWFSEMSSGSLRCPLVHWDVLWFSEMSSGSMRCPLVQWDVLWFIEMSSGSVRCSLVQWDVLWFSEVSSGSVRCHLVQWDVLWFSEMCCGSVRCPLVQWDVLWFRLAHDVSLDGFVEPAPCSAARLPDFTASLLAGKLRIEDVAQFDQQFGISDHISNHINEDVLLSCRKYSKVCTQQALLCGQVTCRFILECILVYTSS